MGKAQSKQQIQFTRFEVVGYPSARFNEIEWRLRQISAIAEPNDIFEVWNGASVLVGFNGTSDSSIQAYMCWISDKDYLDIGRKEVLEEKLIEDFVARGGVPGKRGFFGVSLAGNTAEYYGLGKGMLEQVKFVIRDADYMFVHVHSERLWLLNLYGKIGLEVVGTYIDDGTEFIVMRGEIK